MQVSLSVSYFIFSCAGVSFLFSVLFLFLQILFNCPFFVPEGKVSAMGRSIVVLNKDFGSERFACANIEPDNDIIKYANIRKPPRFVV